MWRKQHMIVLFSNRIMLSVTYQQLQFFVSLEWKDIWIQESAVF